MESLHAIATEVDKVGVLSTRGTWNARLYQDRLEMRGIECVTSTDEEIADLFTPGCYAIKGGDFQVGARLLEQAAQHLLDCGARRLILACTEVPLAFDYGHSPLRDVSIDSNRALAASCVRYWQGLSIAA